MGAKEIKLVDVTPKGKQSVFQGVMLGHAFMKTYPTRRPSDDLVFIRTSKHGAVCLNPKGSYTDAFTTCDLMQAVQILGRLTAIHFTREDYDIDEPDEEDWKDVIREWIKEGPISYDHRLDVLLAGCNRCIITKPGSPFKGCEGNIFSISKGVPDGDLWIDVETRDDVVKVRLDDVSLEIDGSL